MVIITNYLIIGNKLAKSFNPDAKLRIYHIFDEYNKKYIQEDYILELIDGLPNDQINMTDKTGRTVLHYAIKHQHIDVITKLLENPNIDVNYPSNYTPLMESLYYNSDIIRILLEHPDIDVNIQDCNGETVLSKAIEHGYLEGVELLLNCTDTNVNLQDNNGDSPLHKIPFDMKIVKLLLDHPDIDVNIKNFDGDIPLNSYMNDIINYNYKPSCEDMEIIELLHRKSKENLNHQCKDKVIDMLLILLKTYRDY